MQRMIRPMILLLITVLAVPTASAADVFPYEIHKKTLDNGLDVLVIPTPEFKDVVNWNTLILAGSRNEIERGRSGLAHLFEHIAFRHKFEDPENSYDTRIEAIGAFDNAWTWFDVTYYHPVTFASNIEELAAVQAERFLGMDFWNGSIEPRPEPFSVSTGETRAIPVFGWTRSSLISCMAPRMATDIPRWDT